MPICNIDDSLLLIIDIQDRLLNAVFNKDNVLKSCEVMSKASSILNIPVIITEQYPKGLGATISEIKSNTDKNNTYFFEKTDFNALNDMGLCSKLSSAGKKNILLAGIETHICVYQTAIALKEKGYNVVLLKDSCGSRKEFEFSSALDILGKNGVEIKTVEMVLFELLKSSKHPKFKEVQALIK